MLYVLAFSLGALLVLIAAMAMEMLLFSRLFDDPLYGKAASVVVAWLTCSAGFEWLLGTGGFHWRPFLVWLIPAAPVAFWSLSGGYRLRQQLRDAADLRANFD